MEMKKCSTFVATIYCGSVVRATGEVIARADINRAIQSYADLVGLCVTVTDTKFIYTNGHEPGVAVGLINYPRFPSAPKQIKSHAVVIAEILLKTCKQLKVSVVMPDETIMISAEQA